MINCKFRLSLGTLRGDQRGSILVQFTLYLIGILGMIGLAVDGARFLLVKNNLQDLADAAALAAAAQLDGAQDARSRADAAARSLTTPGTSGCGFTVCPNTPTRWFDGAAGTTILPGTNGVQFYSSLDRDTVTTDPRTANYVKVTTGSDWNVTSGFLAGATSILGFTAPSSSASATAWGQGNGNGVNGGVSSCGIVQSFICNPFEASETNPGNSNNFAQNVSVGTMILLVNGAGAAGNWGLLQVPDENANPHNLGAFWDKTFNSQCTSGNQGQTRTGNVAKFAFQGMNVRFDSPFGNGNNCGDDCVSAPIVIDGFQSSGGTGPNKLNGNSCNRIDPGNTWDVATAPCPNPNGPNCNGIPQVPCFDNTSFGGSNHRTSANCPSVHLNGATNPPVATFQQTDAVNSTPGDPTGYQVYQNACKLGSTDPGYGSCPLPRDRTFTTNNIGNGPNTDDLKAYWQNHHSGSFPTIPSNIGPRFYIYQQEVPTAQGGAGTAAFTAASDAVEPHGPVCTNSTVGTGTAALQRRTLYAAIVDCTYWGITGNKPIPPSSLIAQFFMTEPAGTGTTTPSSNGMLHVEYEGCFSSDPSNNDPGNNCVRGTSSNPPPGLVNPGLFKNVQLVR